ncbi:MAG: Uncharacterised protein [Cellulomonadaceae bacterium TMED98]|nr:MAG: Uncharacterised protein [Cellulomonadaceae bacterium TMED98]
MVFGVGLERWHHKITGEFVFCVDHNRLDRAAVQCPLADRVHVFAALTEIDRERDDVLSGLVAQPANPDRRIETARIGKDNAIGHNFLPHTRSARRPGDGPTLLTATDA